MDKYDSSIIETIERLVYEYMCNNRGLKPKSIFISKNIVDLLKSDYRLTVRVTNEEENELTICGLKVYEVIQKGVIKVTD